MRAPSPGTVFLLSAAAMAEPYPDGPLRRGRRKATTDVKADRKRKAARKRQKSARKGQR